MARPREPAPVKLICGMISAQKELFGEAAAAMSEAFAPVDIESEVTDFDLTDYYYDQMGRGLYRKFVSFAGLVDPGSLAAIKLRTNEIEADFARRYNYVPRPINLDPGYLTLAKLVLATTKDYSHRIYLSQGIYAQVTLLYRRKRWEALAWTFPDYASRRYDTFLTAARDSLRGPARGKE